MRKNASLIGTYRNPALSAAPGVWDISDVYIGQDEQIWPTFTPTPTVTPTYTPTATVTPTYTPTATVTSSVTYTPTSTPTYTPTVTPTLTVTPTNTPTFTPTYTPTHTPTITPTASPVYPPSSINYLVVAGGGGGGYPYNGTGGGGAGGVLQGSLSITGAIQYTVTVGGGGGTETNGSNSVFSSITCYGGGFGTGETGQLNGNSGGSGGGGGSQGTTSSLGGAGTSGQGSSGGGGVSDNANYRNGGGGGGAYTGGPSIVSSGLIARYNAGSVSGTTWTDVTGNGYNATFSSAPSIVSGNGNGATNSFNVIRLAYSQTCSFPTGVLPSTYTIFHVCRYNGGQSYRILTGQTTNWLSGFWSGANAVAFHNGWMTQNSTAVYGNNWIISTDQNTQYRANGTLYGNTGYGSPTYDRICINTGAFVEQTDCDVAEIFVYNRTLSQTEIALMEGYLAYTYGISGPSVVTPGTGGTATGTAGAAGGQGVTSTIITSTMASTYSVGDYTSVSGSVYFGGGGGGGIYNNSYGTVGTGGWGGGGNGGDRNTQNNGYNGTAYTGGGGGGQGYNATSPGSGGSGIVIISYPNTYRAALATTGSPTVTTNGSNRVYIFKSSGTITF